MSKVVVESKRFGRLEVPDNKIIDFANGLIGFTEVKRATIVEFKHPFLWLQAIDQPDLAFLVVSSSSFKENVTLPHYIDKLKEIIELDAGQEYLQIFIVSVTDSLKQATVNFKAPIYINLENMKAVQSVIDSNKFNIRTSLWEIVKLRP